MQDKDPQDWDIEGYQGYMPDALSMIELELDPETVRAIMHMIVAPVDPVSVTITAAGITLCDSEGEDGPVRCFQHPARHRFLQVIQTEIVRRAERQRWGEPTDTRH